MVPVDWVALAGVIMGTLIILIPVAGLTARFALKPIVEAVARMRCPPTLGQLLGHSREVG